MFGAARLCMIFLTIVKSDGSETSTMLKAGILTSSYCVVDHLF